MISLTSEQERRLQQLMAAFLYENSLVNLSALRTAEICWPGNILDSINVPTSIPQPLPPEEEGGKLKKHTPANVLHFAREMRKSPTPAEEKLWELIRHDQLGYRFRRQFPISGRILDFYCPELQIAIEVDGPIHQKTEHVLDDKTRDLFLENEYGVRTIRFTNQEVLESSDEVLQKIAAVVKHPPSPPEKGLGVEETKKSIELLDFGTGGGFPLLPLAILHPDWRCTGLDSTAKKLEAVKRICTVCDIPKIRLIHERAETLAKDKEHRGRYDIVTARAVAKLSMLLERCAPLTKSGGEMLFWKSLHIAEELAEAASVAKRLGCVLQSPHTYVLPGDFGERQIIVYRKT